MNRSGKVYFNEKFTGVISENEFGYLFGISFLDNKLKEDYKLLIINRGQRLKLAD